MMNMAIFLASLTIIPVSSTQKQGAGNSSLCPFELAEIEGLLDAHNAHIDEINEIDEKNSQTNFFRAIRENDTATAEMLTAYIPDINLLDQNGHHALYIAAFRGYEELIDLLLRSSADPNTKTSAGQTALQAAQSQGHKGIVAKLLNPRDKVS